MAVKTFEPELIREDNPPPRLLHLLSMFTLLFFLPPLSFVCLLLPFFVSCPASFSSLYRFFLFSFCFISAFPNEACPCVFVSSSSRTRFLLSFSLFFSPNLHLRLFFPPVDCLAAAAQPPSSPSSPSFPLICPQTQGRCGETQRPLVASGRSVKTDVSCDRNLKSFYLFVTFDFCPFFLPPSAHCFLFWLSNPSPLCLLVFRQQR